MLVSFSPKNIQEKIDKSTPLRRTRQKAAFRASRGECDGWPFFVRTVCLCVCVLKTRRNERTHTGEGGFCLEKRPSNTQAQTRQFHTNKQQQQQQQPVRLFFPTTPRNGVHAVGASFCPKCQRKYAQVCLQFTELENVGLRSNETQAYRKHHHPPCPIPPPNA